MAHKKQHRSAGEQVFFGATPIASADMIPGLEQVMRSMGWQVGGDGYLVPGEGVAEVPAVAPESLPRAPEPRTHLDGWDAGTTRGEEEEEVDA